MGVGNAGGDLWAFLDVHEEVGSVAGSAQHSDFWLTRCRGESSEETLAVLKVRVEC